ncbi:conserved hypothetical protein [delta proteobacterium NaphS2]|nr:conserved hypothetical protein [delta proteobacterium NaphS2]
MTPKSGIRMIDFLKTASMVRNFSKSVMANAEILARFNQHAIS